MIRPDLLRQLQPWREVLAATAFGLFGLWIFLKGGYFFQPLGGLIIVLAAIWGVTARRQMRFQREIGAPGLVEVDEGAIRYFAARALGGELPLRDLSEIRLLSLAGRPHWRLKSLDGQALLIPVDAAGAAQLADAFASLPGVDMGRISAALRASDVTVQTVWSRPDRARLT
ncbi:hypothetical protein [Paracoccus aminophilus]|uniref:Uncharacterized protein n=1 Tax=Paracoccus aminophilus JCM 7686 TaxID=1367847 RepID=S5XRN2_PARAH|nr:hypothetical protein [Paracoccus aminophilus]AGT07762.1 hypothetical protein JCM7686_0653 [Paracoccus aminophilus JCM 7686]